MTTETQGTGMGLFRLENVSFAVEGRQLLSVPEMEIEAGRVYGLIGPNGSGKSTLVKLLARQQRPATGRLSFRGQPLAGFADRAFAREVAYMPQFTPPADGLTVRELVALGRFPWHGTLGRFGATDRARVEEAIEQTDLGAMADRLVDSLSGGERQRAWLAMMLAQETGCLILDEPTSALDIAHQVDVLALVRRLSEARGLTVILVLHDVNMAARYCDELIALNSGKVIARGSAAGIMRPETLEAIYHLPMGVLPSPGTGHPVSYVL